MLCREDVGTCGRRCEKNLLKQQPSTRLAFSSYLLGLKVLSPKKLFYLNLPSFTSTSTSTYSILTSDLLPAASLVLRSALAATRRAFTVLYPIFGWRFLPVDHHRNPLSNAKHTSPPRVVPPASSFEQPLAPLHG